MTKHGAHWKSAAGKVIAAAAVAAANPDGTGNRMRTRVKKSNGGAQSVVNGVGVQVRSYAKNGAEDDGDAYENSWGTTVRTTPGWTHSNVRRTQSASAGDGDHAVHGNSRHILLGRRDRIHGYH